MKETEISSQKEKITLIELEPELDACIETKAKREYNRILSQLLRKGEQAELAEELDILRLFLESADFNKLRGESEKHLVEGKNVKFILSLEKGKSKYQMKVSAKA